MQTLREKRLLIKLAKTFGQPIDEDIVNDVEKIDNIQESVLQSIRQNALGDIIKAAKVVEHTSIPYDELPTADELEALVEEIEEPVLDKHIVEKVVQQPTIVERAAAFIQKEVVTEKKESFQQPSVPTVGDIKTIKEKLKFLEQWLGKVSATGPGGGAGSVNDLDHNTVAVTSSQYYITRKDYYVGVNYAGPVDIYLPESSVQGRHIVVKDESGNCASGVHRWITIRPQGSQLIDNKNAANLAINYGSLTFVYRTGQWRII